MFYLGNDTAKDLQNLNVRSMRFMVGGIAPFMKENALLQQVNLTVNYAVDKTEKIGDVQLTYNSEAYFIAQEIEVANLTL